MIKYKEIIETLISNLKRRHRIFQDNLTLLRIESTVDKFLKNEVKEITFSLHENMKQVYQSLNQSPGLKNPEGWDPDEPYWSRLMRIPEYEPIKLFPKLCESRYSIGTCTAAHGLSAYDLPPIKRGDKGVIVDRNSIVVLPQNWQKRIEVLERNLLLVIFHGHLYFLDAEHLNKIKYHNQSKLF